MSNRSVEVIAECGINHQGEMCLAARMIDVAAQCGADTVKFQIYDPETTLDRNALDIRPWWDTILETELSFKDVEFLKSCCDDRGIGFLASAFDVERVGWLTKLGVERYKIAARSIHDKSLAEAIAATGKPIILSLSLAYGDHDKVAIGKIRERGPVRILHCVSEYPTPLTHTGITPYTFLGFDGFSDHTQGITASVMAMSLGAKIIEKHFTMDKSLPGPDHICSADPDELHRLCQMRDDIEEVLYHGG